MIIFSDASVVVIKVSRYGGQTILVSFVVGVFSRFIISVIIFSSVRPETSSTSLTFFSRINYSAFAFDIIFDKLSMMITEECVSRPNDSSAKVE